MARWIGKVGLRAFIFYCPIAVVLWLAVAYLLYDVVPPYMSLDNGRSLVLDPVALVEATSIFVGVALLSWILVSVVLQRVPRLWRACSAVVFTWALLGIPFALIAEFGIINVDVFRAARVMGFGNALAFLPLVIPLISILSGVAYAGGAGLTRMLAGRE